MAFRGAGFVLLELGRPEEAIPYLEDAARIDSTASRPVENLGLAHAAIYDATVRELFDLSRNRPAGHLNPDDSVEKRMRELQAKLAETDWRSEALAYFREAARMEPTEGKYWYNLGTMSKKYRPREPQEFIDALLKAVELDPHYYPALRNLALSLRSEGRLSEAREMCHRMEKVAPGDAAVPSILGDIAYDEGDYKAAERHMLKVLELDAESTHAHITLAYVYRAQGDLERSSEYLEKTVALDPAMEAYIRQSFAADPR
jgi:tetratricopeptide (TPR) repeat protein